MKRVHRSLLSAAVILASGAGLVAYAFRHQAYNQILKSREDTSKRFFDFGRIDVREAVLFTRGTTIRFVRDDHARWQITSPVSSRADTGAVAAMLDQMSAIRADAPVTDDANAESLDSYGLANPRLSLEVTLEDGSKRLLLVGAAHDIHSAHFVTDGHKKRIGLAASAFLGAMERELFAFRDRQVLGMSADDIVRVRLTKGATRAFELARGSDPSHASERPWTVDGRPADPTLVDGFLRILTRDLRAESFPDDAFSGVETPQAARYGLDRPSFDLEVLSRDGQEVRIFIGRAGPDVDAGGPYAHVAGTNSLFGVYEAFPRDVDKNTHHFLDRRLAVFDADRVARVELHLFDGTRVVAQRAESGWRLTHPKSAPARGWRFDGLIVTLSTLRLDRVDTDGTSARSSGAKPLDGTRAQITFYDATEQRLADVRIGGAADPEHSYVETTDLFRVGVIERRKLDFIPKRLDELLE